MQALLVAGINGRRASLFCGLRRFTKCSVPNGHCARSNLYLPFHLTLSFRDFRNRTAEQQPSNRTMFLVVTAQPVHSAYKGSMVHGLRRGPTCEKTRYLQKKKNSNCCIARVTSHQLTSLSRTDRFLINLLFFSTNIIIVKSTSLINRQTTWLK